MIRGGSAQYQPGSSKYRKLSNKEKKASKNTISQKLSNAPSLTELTTELGKASTLISKESMGLFRDHKAVGKFCETLAEGINSQTFNVENVAELKGLITEVATFSKNQGPVKHPKLAQVFEALNEKVQTLETSIKENPHSDTSTLFTSLSAIETSIRQIATDISKDPLNKTSLAKPLTLMQGSLSRLFASIKEPFKPNTLKTVNQLPCEENIEIGNLNLTGGTKLGAGGFGEAWKYTDASTGKAYVGPVAK